MKEEQNELKLHAISSAARLLKVGKETIYNLIENGKLGYIKTGKRIKIPHSELIAMQQRELTFNSSPHNQSTTTNLLEQLLVNPEKSGCGFDPDEFISQMLKERTQNG